jgi:hypothetical protein
VINGKSVPPPSLRRRSRTLPRATASTLQRLTDFSDENVKGANVTSVETKSCCFPPYGLGLANETLCFSLILAISEEDIDIAPRKIAGSVATWTTASSCDEGHLLVIVLSCFAWMRSLVQA